jgi:hypothetical protein
MRLTQLNRRNATIAIAVALIAGLLTYYSPPLQEMRAVNALIARNIAARGGAEAWRTVSSLRLSGQMDLGQGLAVPYELEQKRPGKMCLQFVFDDATARQCADGATGWKIAPYLGRTQPEPMTEAELRETADSADLYGLLFDYRARGHRVELLDHETLDGRETIKLEVTLPRGGVRVVYLDAETALEVQVEARRTLGGRERRVTTRYLEWQEQDGLLIARRQETRTEGDTEWHFVTVERVGVNPPLDDAQFAMPASDGPA